MKSAKLRRHEVRFINSRPPRFGGRDFTMKRSRLHQNHGLACTRAQLRADYFAVSEKLQRPLDFPEFAFRWRNVSALIERIAPGREARLCILTALSESSAEICGVDPEPAFFSPELEPMARELFGDDSFDRLRKVHATLQRLLALRRTRALERTRAIKMAIEIARGGQKQGRERE